MKWSEKMQSHILIFSALFVNELFRRKCDSRSQENLLFLVQCLMLNFQFLAPPEDLDRAYIKQQFKDGVRREDGVRFYTSNIVNQEGH